MGNARVPVENRCDECGKVCFTYTGAEEAARRARRRAHERIEHYRCKSGWWHIGHDVLRDRRGKRRRR